MNKVTLSDIALTTEFAWKLVGIPYKLGGNVPQDGGMDCSAFCLELLRSLGLWNTTDASAQMLLDGLKGKAVKAMGPLTAAEEGLQEGDFMFFGAHDKGITHVGYSVSGRHMREAGGSDKTGMIRLRKHSWRKDLIMVLRFL